MLHSKSQYCSVFSGRAERQGKARESKEKERNALSIDYLTHISTSDL